MHYQERMLRINKKSSQGVLNNQNFYLVTEKEKASQKFVIRFTFTDKNFLLKQDKAIESSSVLSQKVHYF